MNTVEYNIQQPNFKIYARETKKKPSLKLNEKRIANSSADLYGSVSKINEYSKSSKLSTFQIAIIVCLVIAVFVISAIDIGIDVADTVVDAATVGTVGAATGIIDVITEVILELAQAVCIFISIYILNRGDIMQASIPTGISLLLGLGGDGALSVISIFLPFFDIAENTAEIGTEAITLMVYLYYIYKAISQK